MKSSDFDLHFGRCGLTHREEGYRETRYHYDYDLWYILEGKIRLTVNGKKVMLEPGSTYAFVPGDTNVSEIIETTTYYFFHFLYSFSGQQYRCSLAPKSELHRRSRFDETQEQVLHQWQAGAPLSVLELKLLLSQTLKSAYARDAFETCEWVQPQRKSLAETTKEFILGNLNRPIGVEDLAKLMGYQKSYFIQYFKNHVGITPKRYISDIKMDLAKVYISEGKTLARIADLLGYSDAYSFSKAFKRHQGVSPHRKG